MTSDGKILRTQVRPLGCGCRGYQADPRPVESPSVPGGQRAPDRLLVLWEQMVLERPFPGLAERR